MLRLPKRFLGNLGSPHLHTEDLLQAFRTCPQSNFFTRLGQTTLEQRDLAMGISDDKKTILEKLGGESALEAAVENFYGRLLEDTSLQKFFVGRNLSRLKAHQFNFMRTAFTKIPDDLDVPALILEKHTELFRLGLNASHFDTVAGHFVATLEGLKVAPEVITEAVGVISPLRPVFAKGAVEYGPSKVSQLALPAGLVLVAGMAVVAAVFVMRAKK